MVRPIALALAAFALAVPATAFADEAQKSLALAAVTHKGNATDDDAAEMNDAIVSQLVADGRLRLVERQELQRVMKEQALSQSGVMSDEIQIKVAQLLNAKYVAVGAVQTRGKSWVLSLRAIDSESGQVAFAQTLRVGSDEQIEPGSKQLARKLEDKLLGPAKAGAAQAASDEPLGDFDVAQVKDSAKQLARALAMKFPKIAGKIVETVPNGTATCSFPSVNAGFAGQFYEISGVDDVTGQERSKGYFLLSRLNKDGCTGRLKAESGQAVVGGDSLVPMPIKFNLMPLEAGAGTPPELLKLFNDEARAALETMPQFQASNDAQLTAMGRLAGPRGRRSVELQVVDKKGNVVAKLDQSFAF